MNVHKYRYFVGDFETTVYDNQEYTEVWASACVELFTEDVKIFHSIGEQFEYFKSLKTNVVCYFHNLKFDGSFWLAYLFSIGYKQAVEKFGDSVDDIRFLKKKEMENNTFSYVISNLGQWYTITVKTGKHFIEFRDSLKLLPFSVKQIGKSFETKHKKLEMEYKGFRYAGCEITPEEQEYIKNDVLVVKEAVEIMFREGHKRLTIGSCCLAEYKALIGRIAYTALFPNLYDVPIEKSQYGSETAGEYIKKSYRGGWCYLVKGKERKQYHNGVTADVNSLYPSMMSSESGNAFPVGPPTFWRGNYIPDDALEIGKYYFIRVRTRFYLKTDKLPTIQIKSSWLYKATEMLETSDIYKDGQYHTHYYNLDGDLVPATVEMTLTMTDYQLIRDHYDLVDFEILDGCFFDAEIGIFDEYIEKYKKIKMESTGAKRQLAKLFLNNLYGKMAAGTNSSFKVAYMREDESVGFYGVVADDKTPGYIPVGSAITSYARNFTIRAAQENFYGAHKPGFIYADTDSIHCDIPEEQLKGITVHPKNFCCWDLESHWKTGLFVRQKTYIEIEEKEGKEVYNVKCAGMPDKCKNLFIDSITGKTLDTKTEDEKEKLTEEEKEFLKTKRTLSDFDIGLVVPGKLLPHRIKGGVVLKDTTYEMR